MKKYCRLGLLCIFFFVVSEVADGFSTSTARTLSVRNTKQSVKTETRPPTFLAQHPILQLQAVSTAASQLYYRDRDESEVAYTDNVGSASATKQHPSRSSNPSTSNAVKTNSAQHEIGGVSMPLIRAIWYNQASIFLFATAMAAVASLMFGDGQNVLDMMGSLHWNPSDTFHSLFDWQLTPTRVMEGIIATFPMVALGGLVEKSDHRDACHVNFSTTNMVISLFGRRGDGQTTSTSTDSPTTTTTPSSTFNTMMLSSSIALTTGISEEMVFRGYLPAAIMAVTGGSLPLALMGQAVIFALGHVSPRATQGENKVVASLQFANSLWYGLVYMVTGGDIVPCIIAHVLYDMHLLCETWMTINKQMDYTQDSMLRQLDDHEESEIQVLRQQAGPAVLPNETLNFARRFFYAFDYEHKGSLSLSDAQRAVSYAFLHQPNEPSPQDVSTRFHQALKDRQHRLTTYDGSTIQVVPSLPPSDRLTLSEFLRLLFTLKTRGTAAVPQQ